MIDGYKVITLCGSTQFKNEFMYVQKELTLQGNIVLSVAVFTGSDDEDIIYRSDYDKIRQRLIDIHRKKIDMSDAIYVVNPGGYIGSQTRDEIIYAIINNKEVMYLE